MVNQSKTTLQLPVQTSLFDENDLVVIVYGASTANTTNAVAQTATITIENFFQAVANVGEVYISVQQADPANSTALTVEQGVVFASNSFLYIAIANNITRRVAISSF